MGTVTISPSIHMFDSDGILNGELPKHRHRRCVIIPILVVQPQALMIHLSTRRAVMQQSPDKGSRCAVLCGSKCEYEHSCQCHSELLPGNIPAAIVVVDLRECWLSTDCLFIAPDAECALSCKTKWTSNCRSEQTFLMLRLLCWMYSIA